MESCSRAVLSYLGVAVKRVIKHDNARSSTLFAACGKAREAQLPVARMGVVTGSLEYGAAFCCELLVVKGERYAHTIF